LKLCSTTLAITVNIVLKGEGGEDELLMVWICWFYK
jgi:hypothetical protein